MYDKAPTNDIKIVLGNLNAKIDKEFEYRKVTGGHSLHEESNDNDKQVINFAILKDMVISSTCFPKRNIHKWTWSSRTNTQSDRPYLNH